MCHLSEDKNFILFKYIVLKIGAQIIKLINQPVTLEEERQT